MRHAKTIREKIKMSELKGLVQEKEKKNILRFGNLHLVSK